MTLATFAEKLIGKAKPSKADIAGLTIPNRFVVGFGGYGVSCRVLLTIGIES